jgi:neuropeptide Y receptor
MPLTLVEILTKYWPMGRQAVLCKMIGTLQATSIFVSTISITAIALDRYQVS